MIEIKGQIKKFRFRNEDNHYTVAEFLSEEPRTSLIAVGFLVGVRPGDPLILKGVWEKHNRYGQQFKIDSFEPVLPTTLNGIKGYLKALEIKGLSAGKIKALVHTFEEETFTVIEAQPEKLTDIPGIGKVLGARICESWAGHNQIRNLSLFLQELGLPASFCAGIYKAYNEEAVDIISRSPYALVFDFPDMDFSLIDQAARHLGIDRNDPQRVGACLIHLLDGFASDGHTYAEKTLLTERCSVRFGIESARAEQGLDDLCTRQLVVVEPAADRPETVVVYLKDLHLAETGISATLHALNSVPTPDPGLDREEIIEAVLKKLAIKLSDEQLEALDDILNHRVAVITGGPGTGKTTLIRSVTAIFQMLGKQILLSAPTGRAARRLSEVTGEDAATLHRMLQYNIRTGRFDKNRSDPLDADVLIVDEASMVDVPLMYHLLNAVPFHATVIFVGDIFQLPSVGPGMVLSDLIQSERFQTFELTKIFRQAQESPIILNSHRVRYGKPPKPSEKHDAEALSEFYFIETADPAKVAERVVELCARRIPKTYELDPFSDIQVLTPMHKGDAGTISLNAALQQALNTKSTFIERFGMRFKQGDKVMHLKNNYEKDVFNGDIGIITDLSAEDKILMVSYDGREVEYDADDLHELTLAYAISVHKSQGSEYPAVVVPMTLQHRPLLQRNLLYTAMTRGRQLVVIIGTQRALSLALENDRPKQRMSGLKARLQAFPGFDPL